MPLDLPFEPSREDRLIVAACRRRSTDGEDLAVLARPFADEAGAHALIDRAYAHRVPGLVLSALERGGVFDTVDGDAANVFRTHLARHRWRSGLFALELKRLARGFEDAGIECVVLKGASLGPSVYDSVIERFLGDLDLLVHPDVVERALEHLLVSGYANNWSEEAVRGYRTYHYHLPLTRPDGMILELHWDLVKPERPYRLDPLGVIDRSVPMAGLSETLRMPTVEDQILHAVVQQLQDGFTQFSRTVDLDRLAATGRVDWNALASRATVCRLGPALAYAMQVARHLLATECPGEVIEALSPGPVARTHLSFLDPLQSSMDQRFDGHPAAYNLLRLWLTQAESSRVAILAGLARDMADHEPLKAPWTLEQEPPRANGQGLIELAKLAASQLLIYGKAVAGLPTRRFREQMRFWSTDRPEHS